MLRAMFNTLDTYVLEFLGFHVEGHQPLIDCTYCKHRTEISNDDSMWEAELNLRLQPSTVQHHF